MKDIFKLKELFHYRTKIRHKGVDEMDLKTIKSYDNTWWLKHLELTTVYDTKLIKEQFDWLIKRAEKVDGIIRICEEVLNGETFLEDSIIKEILDEALKD